jgi:hypothetical protein
MGGVIRLKARTVFFIAGGLIDYGRMPSTLTFLATVVRTLQI